MRHKSLFDLEQDINLPQCGKRRHGYFGIGYRFTPYIWQKYAFIKQVIKDFN